MDEEKGKIYHSFDEDLKLIRYMTHVDEEFLDEVWSSKGDLLTTKTVFCMKDRYFKKDCEQIDGSVTSAHIHLVSIHDAYKLGPEDRRKANADLMTNPEIDMDEDDRFEISSCSLGFPVRENDVSRMMEVSMERWKYLDPSEGAKDIKNNYKALESFLKTNGFKEDEIYIAKCFVIDAQSNIVNSDRWYTVRGTKRYVTKADSPISRQRMDLKHPSSCSLGVVQADSTGDNPNDEVARRDAEAIFKTGLGLLWANFKNVCEEPFDL